MGLEQVLEFWSGNSHESIVTEEDDGGARRIGKPGTSFPWLQPDCRSAQYLG